MSLQDLGVTRPEQQVYELLLEHPNLTLVELEERTPVSRGRLRTLLSSLAAQGMVSRSSTRPARFVPAPPEVAVEVLAARRRHEIERARLTGAALASLVRHHADAPVELVSGHDAVVQRFQQVQQLARQELLIMDKPPYVGDPRTQQDLQRRLQARGVRYRTIYDRSALENSDRVSELRQLATAGEQARVCSSVPIKLTIADRRIGLVPHGQQIMCVHSSFLLDGLVSLFETLWTQAAPLWSNGRHAAEVLSDDDQQLLALLASGLTDQAIARKIGVAQRTVERRVRRLMDGLGARTRFQAGLQAATRGHLSN